MTFEPMFDWLAFCSWVQTPKGAKALQEDAASCNDAAAKVFRKGLADKKLEDIVNVGAYTHVTVIVKNEAEFEKRFRKTPKSKMPACPIAFVVSETTGEWERVFCFRNNLDPEPRRVTFYADAAVGTRHVKLTRDTQTFKEQMAMQFQADVTQNQFHGDNDQSREILTGKVKVPDIDEFHAAFAPESKLPIGLMGLQAGLAKSLLANATLGDTMSTPQGTRVLASPLSPFVPMMDGSVETAPVDEEAHHTGNTTGDTEHISMYYELVTGFAGVDVDCCESEVTADTSEQAAALARAERQGSPAILAHLKGRVTCTQVLSGAKRNRQLANMQAYLTNGKLSDGDVSLLRSYLKLVECIYLHVYIYIYSER
jgi:hypothetical protein